MHRIAIVEDRQDIATSIGRFINMKDHLTLVGIYSSAEDALSTLPTANTDIVLMDIRLPKMNGIECMLRLKECTPKLAVLMFTVFDTDDKLFDALRFGADGYILKSDGIRGAINAIDDYINGGAPMSKEIARKVLGSLRTQHSHTPLANLTLRQNEILKLLSEGKLNKEIAEELSVTEGTIKQHIYKIFKTLEVSNRVEARNRYLQG